MRSHRIQGVFIGKVEDTDFGLRRALNTLVSARHCAFWPQYCPQRHERHRIVEQSAAGARLPEVEYGYEEVEQHA